MIASARISSLLVTFSAFVFSVVLFRPAVAQFNVMSLIPQDILDAIPEPCREGSDSEFPVAVNCGMGKLGECQGLLGVLPEFGSIPSAENVTDCEDIQEPFCAIAGTCEPCVEEFDILIRCMVLNSDFIDENVTELVDSCPLTC